MKPDIIKDEILDILESLNEQIPILTDYTDKIPQIELDIVMSNLRRLYEDINDLKCIDECPEEREPHSNVAEPKDEEIEEDNQQPATSNLEPETVNLEPETVNLEPETVNLEPETVNLKLETVNPEPETINLEPETINPEPETVNPEPDETPVREPVKIVFETKEEEIIPPKRKVVKEDSDIDLFSTSEPTVADKLKNSSQLLNENIIEDKEDTSIAAKMQQGQIQDIKLAIGLNEKFLFVNELFGGEMSLYTETIDQLNDYKTLDEAIEALNQIKVTQKWEENNTAYKKLLNLLERKY